MIAHSGQHETESTSILLDRHPKITFLLYFTSVTLCEVLFLTAMMFRDTYGIISMFSIASIVFFLASMAGAIILARRHRNSFHHLFLIAGYPLLLSFCLFLLPSNVPDEQAHMRRLFDLFYSGNAAYAPRQLNEVLDDHWVTLYTMMGDYIVEPTDYSDVTPATRFAGYSFVVYLLPSIAAQLCAAFNLNVWIAVFAGRFVNLLIYYLTGYWAIKKLPFGKAFLLVFMLNPLMLQQQTSVSADSLTNTSMILFVVQIFSMRFSNCANPSVNEWIKAFAFAGLVAACKLSNLPLLLIGLILLPKIKQRRIRYGIICAIPLLILLGIMFVAKSGYTGSLAALGKLFCNPIPFLETLGVTLLNATPLLTYQYFGGNLGWPMLNETGGQFFVPIAWIFTALIMVMSIAFAKEEALQSKNKTIISSWEQDNVSVESTQVYKLSLAERIIVLLTGLLVALIAYLALSQGKYYADVELGYISWLQGRHFIPAGFILGFALMPGPKNGRKAGEFRLGRTVTPLFFAAAMSFIALFTISYIGIDFII